MKKVLLLCALASLQLTAQTTRVSTANGDFLNPLNWSPIGVPASGDQLTINHDMVMTTDIYYTAGSITISNGASLMEDATDRNFWVDGTGQIINHGTFKSHLLLASPNTIVYNFGLFSSLDSVWTQTDLINIGQIEVYDILNDEMATLTNEGTITIAHDMNNQGKFNNKPWGSIDLAHDFSNCNLQSLDAVFQNDGIFCIGNNLSNCTGDTLRGFGHYYIGNAGSNIGVLEGTATFHTPSGSFAIAGTVGTGVTITTGACALNVTEEALANDLVIYPNPATAEVKVSINGNYTVYDLGGQVVMAGQSNGLIDVSALKSGIYFVEIRSQRVKLIKQ